MERQGPRYFAAYTLQRLFSSISPSLSLPFSQGLAALNRGLFRHDG